MTNKEEVFQTTNEVMLTVVLADYKDDLVLSAQRLLIFKADNDMETYGEELPFYMKTNFKIKQIEQLIADEQSACSSVAHIVSVRHSGEYDVTEYVAPSVADRW